MSFVVVDRKGKELIFDSCPEYDRYDDCWVQLVGQELVYIDYADFDSGVECQDKYFYGIELPQGTIEKIIGRKLTLKNEPVELK